MGGGLKRTPICEWLGVKLRTDNKKPCAEKNFEHMLIICEPL